MRFQVLDPGRRPGWSDPRHQAYLVKDNWNDYWEFRTQFFLIFVDREGTQHEIGQTKIGYEDMPPGDTHTAIPDLFDALPLGYFSVGQDETFYSNLNNLGATIRDEILSSLQDIAKFESIFDLALRQYVTTRSLLRGVSARSVLSQFRRIANGGVRLTPFQFSYISPPEHGLGMSFAVEPESRPPTNVHVLIGRNGVGKTHVMNAMANALLLGPSSAAQYGHFLSGNMDSSSFVNLVFVSFSAFDLFRPLPAGPGDMQFAYVGLQAEDEVGQPKNYEQLRSEFVASLESCAQEPRKSRWKNAVLLLESDPIFQDATPSLLFEAQADRPMGLAWAQEDDLATRAARLFHGLSSGHKIVLLTVTRLVETVAERSLVLMDEPEAHLHPPLLSAFIRALSDLLIDRNGVAIIATHSPVILQEVPRTCVWKVRRSGHQAACDRPQLETFGENVGVLTNEVFGLEVTKAGFHSMLTELVDRGTSYMDVVAAFNGQLGEEARGIVQGLIATRDQG